MNMCSGVFIFGTNVGESYRLPAEYNVFQVEVLRTVKSTKLMSKQMRMSSRVTIFVDNTRGFDGTCFQITSGL